MQALGPQHMEQKGECETQEDTNSPSLTEALTVPIPILVSRFRNRREVELVMNASNLAVTFDTVLETYEMVSIRAQALQEAWDNLWISQEPFLLPAIPLIGEKMSGINRMRAHLLKNMDAIIENLQAVAKVLVQYAEINLSVAEELRMEGIDHLATNKLFLYELEQELAKRINVLCTKGSIHQLSGNMSDFIKSLTVRLQLDEHTLCYATTLNPGCNSLNKSTEPGQNTDPMMNSSFQCQKKMMGNNSASAFDFRAFPERNSEEINSDQHDSTLACGVTLTSAVGTCFTSGGLAHNDTNIIAQNNSSASEEQLPELRSRLGCLQERLANKENEVGTGIRHVHFVNQNAMDSHNCSDAANSIVEASETA